MRRLVRLRGSMERFGTMDEGHLVDLGVSSHRVDESVIGRIADPGFLPAELAFDFLDPLAELGFTPGDFRFHEAVCFGSRLQRGEPLTGLPQRAPCRDHLAGKDGTAVLEFVHGLP